MVIYRYLNISGTCLTNLDLIGIHFNIRGYRKSNDQKCQTLYMQLIPIMADKTKNKLKIQQRLNSSKIQWQIVETETKSTSLLNT